MVAEGKKSHVSGATMLTMGREMRRAVLAGLMADVVDLGSIVYGISMGHIPQTAGGLLGAAAVGAIGLAGVCLRDL